VNITTGFGKNMDRPSVTSRRRPHERALPMNNITGINVRTSRHQGPDSGHLTCSSNCHEHSFAFRKRGVRIRTGIEESLNDTYVTIDRSQRQRLNRIPVRCSYVSISIEKHVD
jgi:hypothetical protein